MFKVGTSFDPDLPALFTSMRAFCEAASSGDWQESSQTYDADVEAAFGRYRRKFKLLELARGVRSLRFEFEWQRADPKLELLHQDVARPIAELAGGQQFWQWSRSENTISLDLPIGEVRHLRYGAHLRFDFVGPAIMQVLSRLRQLR